MTTEQISPAKRLTAMLLDHIVMTVIAMLFSIPYSIYLISDTLNSNATHTETYKNLLYLPLFALSLYFCKDCLNGQSFAKRKLKLQVVDNKTNEVASPIKCFIRDLFCILFPVEIIVALDNPYRRIGDIVAGTRLVTVNESHTSTNNQYGQALLCVTLSFGIYVTIYKLTGRL
jgi:uncharacterized RDD family membrane protein YckC